MYVFSITNHHSLPHHFPMPLVEILTIGTELILGRIADANAPWLAQQIEQSGIRVRQMTTMGDDPDEIIAVIHEAIKRGTTHIITTGGLGPTPDDKTVATIATMVGCGTVTDDGLVAHFLQRLRPSGQNQISDHMRKVAIIPEVATAGPNTDGWGHCIMMTYCGVALFILPGPPREVRALYPMYIEPKLKTVRRQEYI